MKNADRALLIRRVLEQRGAIDLGRWAINELSSIDRAFLASLESGLRRHSSNEIPWLKSYGQPEDIVATFKKLGNVLPFEDFFSVLQAAEATGDHKLVNTLAGDFLASGKWRENISLSVFTSKYYLNEHVTFEVPQSEKPEKNFIKIVGVMKSKSDGALLELAVRHFLNYVDEIIISTNDYAENNHPFGAQVKIIPQLPAYVENEVYDKLFLAARQLNATHISHLDADEFIFGITPEDFRSISIGLKPGESIAATWTWVLDIDGEKNCLKLMNNSWFEKGSFQSLIPRYKDIVYCDDGCALHKKLKLHTPWIPENFPVKRYVAEAANLLHLEGLSAELLNKKLINYFFWDFRLERSLSKVLRRYLPIVYRNHLIRSDLLSVTVSGLSATQKNALENYKEYFSNQLPSDNGPKASNNNPRDLSEKLAFGLFDTIIKEFVDNPTS